MGEKRFICFTDISAYFTKETIGSQIEKASKKKLAEVKAALQGLSGARRIIKDIFHKRHTKRHVLKDVSYRTTKKPLQPDGRYKEETARFEKL